MIQYHVFPGGKKRIVTFSYDDGSPLDERLISIFNRYGVKGTFHLVGGKYLSMSDEELAKVRRIYEGHEIACHTIHHGWPARMPMQSVLKEVWEDRQILEKLAGYPVVGMSYPSGSFSDDVLQVLDACGVVYSRTTLSTQNFMFPADFRAWHPSCHHRDALTLADRFLDNIDSQWTHPMFYIWGHAHEFRTEEDWAYIEKVAAKLAGNDRIWYATNIEIYDYVMAQKQLRISADEKTIVNPTALDLWVEKNKTQIVKIPAGQTVRID